ncbi:MAG: penicillin-binding protein, partial [Zoogloea sp.]|nr:penicillin-binding protein [Zoogloea sp.]
MPLLLRLKHALAGVLRALRSRLAPWLSRLRRPTRRELTFGVAAVPALLLLYGVILIPFTPGISDIRKAKLEQPARVLSGDGKELAVFKWANREWVGLERISPQVTAALIATEDHRFYEHHGIDFYRLGGAALRTFTGDKQGGSTLTQQLARNLFPDEIGRAPTLTRKLKEAITAFKIEAVYSKDEILETYLNTVPFLYNAWGIEMAARTYFDKPARSLDVLEAATLVGMLKGNSYYNPVLNPERAVARRNTVLAQMVKRGRLDAARLPALEKKPLRIDFERQLEAPGPAPHFAQQIRKALIAWADSHDYNIYADGLVVRTTLDSRLQAQATQAVQRRGRQLQALADQAWAGRKGWTGSPELVEVFVRESKAYRAAVAKGEAADAALARLLADRAFIDALRQDKTRLQAGFLAVDPRNGQVRAWVGSRDFQLDPFDHVAQARRQPGSTFKPFVYGAAFDKGMKPTDTLVDQEVEIPLPNDEVWRPTDDGPPSGKPVSLRDGL